MTSGFHGNHICFQGNHTWQPYLTTILHKISNSTHPRYSPTSICTPEYLSNIAITRLQYDIFYGDSFCYARYSEGITKLSTISVIMVNIPTCIGYVYKSFLGYLNPAINYFQFKPNLCTTRQCYIQYVTYALPSPTIYIINERICGCYMETSKQQPAIIWFISISDIYTYNSENLSVFKVYEQLDSSLRVFSPELSIFCFVFFSKFILSSALGWAW